jgi:hypothetical protein
MDVSEYCKAAGHCRSAALRGGSDALEFRIAELEAERDRLLRDVLALIAAAPNLGAASAAVWRMLHEQGRSGQNDTGAES